MFQGPNEDVFIIRDKGRVYVIILTLTDGLQALSIHLETHEDVIVSP